MNRIYRIKIFVGWPRPVFQSEILFMLSMLSMLSILSKISGVRVVRVVRG
jgi:hypothetical protein